MVSVADEFVERVDHLARVPDDRRIHPLSFAYYRTQKVEVTEYTTSHERRTKWPNHTESGPDDEDDLHHGAGRGNANRPGPGRSQADAVVGCSPLY